MWFRDRGMCKSRHALLSQEGSVIETKSKITRAEVPKANSVNMRLWNLPSRGPFGPTLPS